MQTPKRKHVKWTHETGGRKFNKNVFAPGAKCPNHGCRLYLTDQKGVGLCEISTCAFNYEEGPDIEKVDDQTQEFTIKIINGKPQKVLNRPAITKLVQE